MKQRLKPRNWRALEKPSRLTRKKFQKLSRYERNANTITLSSDDSDRAETQMQVTLKTEEAEAEAPHAKQRSYAEVEINKVQFVLKNNYQNNNNHPKEKLSQGLRNNARKNGSKSQRNGTNSIPKTHQLPLETNSWTWQC